MSWSLLQTEIPFIPPLLFYTFLAQPTSLLKDQRTSSFYGKSSKNRSYANKWKCFCFALLLPDDNDRKMEFRGTTSSVVFIVVANYNVTFIAQVWTNLMDA